MIFVRKMVYRMNIVIISGKMVSNVDFKFIYIKDKKERYTSIAMCKLKLDNGSIVDIYGYDDVADYLYRNNLEYVFIEGRVDNKMKIEVRFVKNIKYYKEK